MVEDQAYSCDVQSVCDTVPSDDKRDGCECEADSMRCGNLANCYTLVTYLLTYLLCCQCETRDEGTFNKTSMIWTYFGFTADKYENPIDDGKPLFRECLKSMRCRFGNNTNLYKHLKDHHQLLQYRKTQV